MKFIKALYKIINNYNYILANSFKCLVFFRRMKSYVRLENHLTFSCT